MAIKSINGVITDIGGNAATASAVAASAITGTTLASSVVTSSLTTVGALNSGSITSGFGAIDVGADAISGGAGSFTTLSASSSVHARGFDVPASGVGAELGYSSPNVFLRGYDRTGSAYKNLTLNDNITVVGGSAGQVSMGPLAVTGTLSATDAISTTTGANGVVVSGGTGVSKRANVIFQGTNASSVSKVSYVGVNVWGTDGALEIYSGTGTTRIGEGGTAYATVSSTGLAVTGALSASTKAAIGTSVADQIGLNMDVTMSTSSSQYGLQLVARGSSAATTGVYGYYCLPLIAASTATTSSYGYYAAGASLGSGASLTNHYAFYAPASTAATNNHGVYIVGANTLNVLAGYLVVGSTTVTSYRLDVTGDIRTSTVVRVGAATQSADGAGITFPATQNASADANTLDDYREFTYEATATGMTTSPTGTVTCVRVGNVVTMELPTITGTSNATSFVLTGGPSTMRPSVLRTSQLRAQDNGGAQVVGLVQINTNGNLALFANYTGNVFTASGTKSVGACTLSYII